MDIANKLLEKTFTDIKSHYIGIFVKGKVIVSKYIKKPEKLEDYFSRMIERSFEINTAIKNFNAEFLFSGGKDFSIMIYYVTSEIAIGIIHIGKPNFSFLKIAAQDLARELKNYEKDILLYYEEYLKSTEEQVKSEEKENYQTDIDELEKVIVQANEIIVDTNISTPSSDKISSIEIKKNETNIAIPSLEDILSLESQDTSSADTPNLPEDNLPGIDNILNGIEKEFVKIMGPFGKYVFKNRKNNLLKKNITKSTILEFVRFLVEDIPETEKRELFLKNINDMLIFIL